MNYTEYFKSRGTEVSSMADRTISRVH